MQSITDRIEVLSVNDSTIADAPPCTVQEKIAASCDFARLYELDIVDVSAKIKEGFGFTPIITKEMRANLDSLLQKKRKNGYALSTLIKTVMKHLGSCSAPVLAGQALKGILGWDFLFSQFLDLVHQKDANLQLEDCLSAETIELAKENCQVVPGRLTIYFDLSNKKEELKATTESLYSSLQLILKDAICHMTHSSKEMSSFCYNSLYNGLPQSIHFVFAKSPCIPIATGDAIQILLTDDVQVLDNMMGSQWCVDTMLKYLRLNALEDEKELLDYLRCGYDPRGGALDSLTNRLFVPDCQSAFLFWKEGNCSLQDIFVISQIAVQSQIDPQAFITQVLDSVEKIDPTMSLWHAGLSLLQDKSITYLELEAILQIFGMVASTLHSEGRVRVVCASPFGIPCLSMQHGDLVFRVPLDALHALNTFKRAFVQVESHKSMQILLDAFFEGISTKNRSVTCIHTTVEPLLLNAAGNFFTQILFGCLSSRTEHLTESLKELVPILRSSTPEKQHIIGITLKAAFASQELDFPKKFQNGGLQLEHFETEWIDYLLTSSSFALNQMGTALLLSLEGHVDFCCKWIPRRPDLAESLISRIENDPALTEPQVRKWLHANNADVIWHNLVTSSTGRWRRFSALTRPDIARGYFERRNVMTCRKLLNAMTADDAAYRDLFLSSLLTPDGLELYAEAVKNTLESLEQFPSDKAKKVLQTNLKPFVAKALESSQFIVAMRFLKVAHAHGINQFDDADRAQILTSAEQPLPRDLIDWYFSIIGTVIPYKYLPVRQVRIYLGLVKNEPGVQQGTHVEYMHKLCIRMPEEDKLLLQTEIGSARGAITSQLELFDEIFKCFYVQKKEKAKAQSAPNKSKDASKIEVLCKKGEWKSAVQLLMEQSSDNPECLSLARAVVNGLLELRNPDPHCQVFDLLTKYKSLLTSHWQTAFKVFTEKLATKQLSAGLLKVLANRADLPLDVQRKIWGHVFSNSQLLNARESLPVFAQLAYFKTLFPESGSDKFQTHLGYLIKVLLGLMKEQFDPAYVAAAYDWYELLGAAHREKTTIGISLLELCRPKDTQEQAVRACQLVDALVPALGTLFSNKDPKAHPRVDSLREFCHAAVVGYPPEVAEASCARLVQALGLHPSLQVNQFALREFGSSPGKLVQVALWEALKKVIKATTQGPLLEPAKGILQNLLKTAELDLLIGIFIHLLSQNPTFPREPLELYTESFTRILSAAVESPNRAHCKEALAIDVHMHNSWKNQIQHIEKSFVDYNSLRLHLLLRHVQYHGWTENSQLNLKHVFLSLPNCGIYSTPARTQAFYSWPLGKSLETHVFSVYPVRGAHRNTAAEIHTLIYTGMRFACEKQNTFEEKTRLLNFVVQNIRNLIEHYPQASFHFDSILLLHKCIVAGDQLFSQHCSIIFSLLRMSISRNCICIDDEAVTSLLGQIGRNSEDLQKEDLEGLNEIKGRLESSTEDTAESVLFHEQEAFLLWQASSFIGAYKVRQEMIDRFFAIWRKVPTVVKNTAVIESMRSIMLMNSVPFGSNRGADGQLAALNTLESFFDCYMDIYKCIVQRNPQGPYKRKNRRDGNQIFHDWSSDGKFADNCLQAMISELLYFKQMNAYENNYDRFLAHARKIITVFELPCFFEPLSLILHSRNFTDILLSQVQSADEHIKQGKLVSVWLQTLKMHEAREDFDMLIPAILSKITKSKSILYFTEPALSMLFGSIDAKVKIYIISEYVNFFSLGPIMTASTLDCLHLCYKTLLQIYPKSHAVSLPIAKKCLSAMVIALRNNDETDFAGNANRVMQLVQNPCYTEGAELVGLFSSCAKVLCSYKADGIEKAKLMEGWLKVVLTWRSNGAYRHLVKDAIDICITAAVIPSFGDLDDKANATLDTCLEDWTRAEYNQSEELRGYLKAQLKQRELIKQSKVLASIDEELCGRLASADLGDK